MGYLSQVKSSNRQMTQLWLVKDIVMIIYLNVRNKEVWYLLLEDHLEIASDQLSR